MCAKPRLKVTPRRRGSLYVLMTKFVRSQTIALAAVLALLSIPSVGAQSEPSAELVSGAPTWMTSSLRAAVIAAGSQGVPLPPEAAVSSAVFAGLRPGTWMIDPNWCTLNFIFSTDGTMNGKLFIGTAKHCVQRQTSTGEFDPNDSGMNRHVIAAFSTKPSELPRLFDIGAVADVSSGGLGNDYALIAIQTSLIQFVSPSMAWVGGPTKPRSGAVQDQAFLVGHGTGLGTGGTFRIGRISSFSSSAHWGFGMLSAATPGDSGSPVRTLDGAAVGDATHIGASLDFVPGNVFGTSVDLVASGLEYGTRATVVTCRSNDIWVNLGCP